MVWVSLQLRMEQISGLWLCETFLREVPQPKEICIWHQSFADVQWRFENVLFWCFCITYWHTSKEMKKGERPQGLTKMSACNEALSPHHIWTSRGCWNLRTFDSRKAERKNGWLMLTITTITMSECLQLVVENWKLHRLTGLLLLHLDVPSHWLCLRILRVCLVSLSLHFHIACWRSFAMCGASTVPAVAARRSLFHLSIS